MTDKSPEELAREWAHEKMRMKRSEFSSQFASCSGLVSRMVPRDHTTTCDRLSEGYLGGRTAALAGLQPPKRTCDHMVDPRDKFCLDCWNGSAEAREKTLRKGGRSRLTVDQPAAQQALKSGQETDDD